MEDYSVYTFSKQEYILYSLRGLFLSSIIAYLFYRSILSILLFSPYFILYCKQQKKKCIKTRKWNLNIQFRDAIINISGALNAGYSIENAIKQSTEDLKLMYEKDSYIVKEFEYMTRQLKNNQTIEDVFLDFSNRSKVEDICNFTEVFITAKRTGGDLIKIIRRTSNSISDKIEVKREIITLITAKKFESSIMNFIPLGIILYMWLFSPGFMDPLYGNIKGVVVMSAALVLYGVAYKISQKIIDIEV
ncbi:type II secretion system F family protein [Anaeromicropila herbilytica]